MAIISDRPFKEGYWISIGDLQASVSKLRLRATMLTTFDNEFMVVSNKQLAQERVINYTLTPKARVSMSICIAYKEDIDTAGDILLNTIQDAAAKNPFAAASGQKSVARGQ
ncbi:MAG: mechanosensitive ion channel domain-containing protein [Thermodesulfobacteriota bacterium]